MNEEEERKATVSERGRYWATILDTVGKTHRRLDKRESKKKIWACCLEEISPAEANTGGRVYLAPIYRQGRQKKQKKRQNPV